MDCDLECSSNGDEAVRAPMSNHDKEIIIAGLVGLDLPPKGMPTWGPAGTVVAVSKIRRETGPPNDNTHI